MIIRYPQYYEFFHCVAAACPDSCCKEWTVDVDSTSAAYYRALKGPLGDRLREVLQDTEDGTIMEIESGRCPMWRQDGLCRIQAELGHEALCKTCRDFPRLYHDYGYFGERGLELSCPEAARLILTSPMMPLTEKQEHGGETPEYEKDIMQLLLLSRSTVLDYLANTTHTPGASLAVLLLYGHSVQSALDGAELEPFCPEKLLAEAKEYAGEGNGEAILQLLSELEVLTDTWSLRLQTPAAEPLWAPEMKNLAAYFVTRYWLQAVSDYDLVSRVKLTVVACLSVRLLGGDAISTAQLFSKEIENNGENIESLLDAAYTTQALTDLNLLRLSLSD